MRTDFVQFALSLRVGPGREDEEPTEEQALADCMVGLSASWRHLAGAGICGVFGDGPRQRKAHERAEGEVQNVARLACKVHHGAWWCMAVNGGRSLEAFAVDSTGWSCCASSASASA